MELFDWLRYLYDIWKNIDEELITLSSLTGMGELMKNGCTTCFDHHYVFPRDGGDLIAAQFEAAGLIGMRMHASRGSMDLSKKDGGLPPDSVVQTIDEIMKDSVRLIEKYHDPSKGSMRQIALAPCSPFSVSGELLRESAVLARQYGVRLHTHLCETKDEENYTLERCGMRPYAYMESLGWTGPDVWYAHGIHFNADELKALADTGTGVAHCPISNMKLSSGIARIPEMLKLGVTVGLGVDGSASNDGSSLLEEMRVAYLLHRLKLRSRRPHRLRHTQDGHCGQRKAPWPGGHRQHRGRQVRGYVHDRQPPHRACRGLLRPGLRALHGRRAGSRGLHYSQRQNNRKGGPPCEYRRGKALGRRR